MRLIAQRSSGALDDLRAFCDAASTELQAALLPALWTGQRQGDLLRLTWKDYDGRHIRLRQSKGGQRVMVPVGPPLKAALDAALQEERKSVTILVNSFGRPWTEDGFRTSWGKAFKKTSLKDLHIHDLRGTLSRALRCRIAPCLRSPRSRAARQRLCSR